MAVGGAALGPPHRAVLPAAIPALPGLPDSRDTCILEAGEAEGIYIAELDVAQLRRYRELEVHGNAYRHPGKYGLLTERKIEFPFVRKDYRA